VKIVCDIETERLENPEIVWVAICKEVESGKVTVFKPYLDGFTDLSDLLRSADVVIGHNWLGFDGPVLERLGGVRDLRVLDTLVVSRLLNFNQLGGHSLESWGERLGYSKGVHTDFSQYSRDMETYCARDVDITLKLYEKFRPYLEADYWQPALELEHRIAELCTTIGNNGFHFDVGGAKALLREYTFLLSSLDESLAQGFPPRYIPIREITPRGTAYGTLHKGDFRWIEDGDLSPFTVGAPFTRIAAKEFDPASPKEIVRRLNQAGWKPTDKTKGHIIAEQEGDEAKLEKFREFGWRVSEENLATLPETAPTAARTLVHRLTLASRISDLEEWIACYEPSTGRIHGKFLHIGSWTHRMSHNSPNMANIPGVIEIDEGSLELDRYKAPLNRSLRALWGAPEDRFLVGCDADSIQLRVFAHYIDDEEFTFALCQGSKKDKTDPHSVNQRALGPICKTRQHAKTFIYSFLMGAGVPKLAQVLECSTRDSSQAKDNFMERYPKYAQLRNVQTPKDAARGYFIGMDGRQVVVTDKHKVISGYLQNGESIIMKRANLLWVDRLNREEIDFRQVNYVHDEWQTEVPRDRNLALYVGQVQAEAIKLAGEELNLKCPMMGSYRIGRNWYDTH
jgi:DNA polymerase-1